MSKTGTYKNWVTLVYPDESYQDWFRRLGNSFCEIAISPLHENDHWREGDRMVENPRCGSPGDLLVFNMNIKAMEAVRLWLIDHKEELVNDDGSLPVDQIYETYKPKKPHHHVFFHFAGSKSQEQVEKICCECIAPCPPKPFKADSPSGYIRYLVHYDDPDKEQFPISSIITLNGFDVSKYFLPTQAQQDEIVYNIMQICAHNELYSFDQLLDWLVVRAKRGDFLEEFRYCQRRCNFVARYVDSRGKYKRYKELDEQARNRVEAIDRIAQVIDEKFM